MSYGSSRILRALAISGEGAAFGLPPTPGRFFPTAPGRGLAPRTAPESCATSRSVRPGRSGALQWGQHTLLIFGEPARHSTGNLDSFVRPVG